MTEQVAFTLRGRNPDVLTCIANLSNDEVFTPPEFANKMLDTLAKAWADNNKGADIWADETVRFLDPCTKSGVFLREITKRLTKGLEHKIANLQKRVDHILSKQVFGIATTYLTSLLARRSLYCSKHANGKHSIAKDFRTGAGNVWFERLEHNWDGTNCRYCRAPRSIFDRGEGLETHVYAFIHTDHIKARIAELFGGDVQFDVVIGNPPYQMTGGAGGSSDSSIYHLFVQQALKLNPRFASMVMPSRWLAGGRGMDDFRKEMLTSGKLRYLVDFPISKGVFPGVEVKGGLSYFLWDASFKGDCEISVVRDGIAKTSIRPLDEFDVFIRDPQAVDVLKRVLDANDSSMADLISNREPFKLESNFKDYHPKQQPGDIALFRIEPGKRRIDWVARSIIEKNSSVIDSWKVLVPKAYNGGDAVPHQILGKPLIAPPPSVCTGSYLVIRADSEEAAKSIQSYYTTKFFRFLVSLRKITQDAFSHMYQWVPQQSWDRTWTDKMLYRKYSLSQNQIDYVEAVIKPMNLDVPDNGDE